MGGIENSNYYVDIDAINELQTKYNTAIDTLTELYFNLEKEIINIEDQEQWQGESFKEFKEVFDKWKLTHVKRLTELVQLKDFLEEVVAVTEVLVSERDNLTNYLGV